MTTSTGIYSGAWKFSMIAAPLFIGVAQFYWINGLLSPTAGSLQVLGFALWIPAFQGMFSLVKKDLPIYATLGFMIAAYACVGGAGFGYDGIYTHAMGMTSTAETSTFHNAQGLPLILALFLPGILFPLSLIGIGVQLIRSKKVSTWIGLLLILAAVGFPLSRIPRIDWIAHIDNALLLVSHMLIAFNARFTNE